MVYHLVNYASECFDQCHRKKMLSQFTESLLCHASAKFIIWSIILLIVKDNQ